MMVLQYYGDGNLRNNLMNNRDYKEKNTVSGIYFVL
jgi:hypothetical protein